MGTGIAIVAARGGMKTIIYDIDATRVERARKDAEAFFTRAVALGKLEQSAVDAALARLVATTNIDDLAEADLVIEAIFEDFNFKAELLAKLDRVTQAHAILASNTSTLSITRLAKASNRPDRFVGLHFCLPAQLMKLVEITPGLLTSEQTLERAEQFCSSTGQVGIRTRDTPGFILNYFAIPLNNDAIRLVEQGVATADAIDTAIRKSMGFPMGPLQLVDLVGLDTQERLCDAFFEITRDPRHACPNLVRQMVAAGQIGKRAGRGFYEYASANTFGA
jgi:3-hydroxybutyryl-CoA dehydrogenase